MLTHVHPSRLRSVVAVAVLIGIVAGLASATLVSAIGEPLVEDAIALEEAAVSGEHAPGEPELVARSAQRGFGLFAALGLSGAVFGLLFGLVFWALRRGRGNPFRRALVVGSMLFGSLTLAPWLKYPPNPPAVGSPDTLDQRQALYVSLIALSLALCLAAVALAGRLRHWPEHRRVAAVVLAVVVPFALALALLPPAPDPVQVPATLIWRFRLASLAGNALLWAVLSLGVGLVTAEDTRRRKAVIEPPVPTAAL